MRSEKKRNAGDSTFLTVLKLEVWFVFIEMPSTINQLKPKVEHPRWMILLI